MKHLSRFDIEAIAVKYVQAYMALPDVRNTQIYRIDQELLLEKVLGLNVEYQHLSYDGSILGMTSFTEMGVQVFEDDDIILQENMTAEDIEDWDSLTHIQLIENIEVEFGITFTLQEVTKLNNIGEFIDLTEQKVGEK